MNKLLKIEALKIFNYKVARFFIIAYFAMLGVSALVLSQDISLFGLEINLGEMGIFDFPDVWHFITYFAAIAKLFLAIILITTVTNEFSYGTLKQNLIDGLTKKEFILSKTLTAILFALASTIFVFVIGLALGLNFSEEPYGIFDEFEYVPAYFLKLIAFFAFCIFLSVLVRKSAFAFALFFVWWIIEGILSGIELAVRLHVFKEPMESLHGHMLTSYLPLTSMSELIPFPFKRIEAVDVITQGQINMVNIRIEYVLASIFYFCLFIYLSYALIKRRDL